MKYKKLIEDLRLYMNDGDEEIRNQAADAIEELQIAKCPHYIRNVHDRGDDSLCTKWECEVKAFPKWIPVTERLPEDGTEVLAFNKTGFAYVDCWTDGKWKINSMVDEEHESVTHWMPIPQPPESDVE